MAVVDLLAITAFCKSFTNWDSFQGNADREFPVYCAVHHLGIAKCRGSVLSARSLGLCVEAGVVLTRRLLEIDGDLREDFDIWRLMMELDWTGFTETWL